MSDEKQRETALLLTPEVARDFECLLVEYADLVALSPDECRSDFAEMVGAAGVHAMNRALIRYRQLTEEAAS